MRHAFDPERTGSDAEDDSERWEALKDENDERVAALIEACERDIERLAPPE